MTRLVLEHLSSDKKYVFPDYCIAVDGLLLIDRCRTIAVATYQNEDIQKDYRNDGMILALELKASPAAVESMAS